MCTILNDVRMLANAAAAAVREARGQGRRRSRRRIEVSNRRNTAVAYCALRLMVRQIDGCGLRRRRVH